MLVRWCFTGNCTDSEVGDAQIPSLAFLQKEIYMFSRPWQGPALDQR